MNIYHYDYINGDELGYWQYANKHHPSQHNWFWHFTYATRRSWLKKCLFFNLLSINGIIILVCFVFLSLLAHHLFAVSPFVLLLPILACVPWVYERGRSHQRQEII